LKLFEQFQMHDHVMARVNFSATLCSIEGRIYSNDSVNE